MAARQREVWYFVLFAYYLCLISSHLCHSIVLAERQSRHVSTANKFGRSRGIGVQEATMRVELSLIRMGAVCTPYIIAIYLT